MKTLLFLLLAWSGVQRERVPTEHVDLIVKENVYEGEKFQYSTYIYYSIVKTDHVERNFLRDQDLPQNIIMDFFDDYSLHNTKHDMYRREIYAVRDTSMESDTELVGTKPYKFLVDKYNGKRYIIADSFYEEKVYNYNSAERFRNNYPDLIIKPIW